MPDEASLIRKYLQSRNESDFLKLYDICNDSLFRMSLFLSDKNPERAYDLLQETWITGLIKLKDFKGTSGLKSWLTGILINKSRNERRKKRPVSGDLALFTWAHHEEAANVTRLDLEYALMHLSEGYREVLLLHDLEGYTHKEIAEMLGIHEGTSKSQLFQARKKMRQIIQQDRYEKQTNGT